MEVRKILLDTSAYSSYMRNHADIVRVIQQAEEIYLNAIVVGELRAGFLKGSKKQKNEKELESFLVSPRVAVATIGTETSTRYAAILNSLREAGTPIPTNDVWIAASAMELGLTVLTMDTHFQQVKQVLVQLF